MFDHLIIFGFFLFTIRFTTQWILTAILITKFFSIFLRFLKEKNIFYIFRNISDIILCVPLQFLIVLPYHVYAFYEYFQYHQA